jgi:hypothetical protein
MLPDAIPCSIPSWHAPLLPRPCSRALYQKTQEDIQHPSRMHTHMHSQFNVLAPARTGSNNQNRTVEQDISLVERT